LPLAQQQHETPRPLEGRRRLAGAFSIDLTRIRPDPHQPRRNIDDQALTELTASVKRLGILQPITVRYIEPDNVYQIITGERRYQAARRAALKEIPCWIQDPRDEQVLLHQVVENWQRSDMHPYELADALARLRDANGLNQASIADVIGKSKGEISKLFALLDLDPAVQKLAREDQTGNITKRHLYAVRTLPPEDQLRVVLQVQRGAIAVVEAEKLVARQLDRQPGAAKRGTPVTTRRFTTNSARISLLFRKHDITDDDVLVALEEVRIQIRNSDTTGFPEQAA